MSGLQQVVDELGRLPERAGRVEQGADLGGGVRGRVGVVLRERGEDVGEDVGERAALVLGPRRGVGDEVLGGRVAEPGTQTGRGLLGEEQAPGDVEGGRLKTLFPFGSSTSKTRPLLPTGVRSKGCRARARMCMSWPGW